MAIFEVNAVSKSATQLEVQARQFTLTVDEPPMLGGEDNGANPVEFILAGFLGCLNVVIHVVAQERGVELRGIKAHAEGDLNPAMFLQGESPDRPGFKAIEVSLEIDSDASAEVISGIVAEAEQRCPVSDNLANITPIQIAAKVVTPV